LLSPELAAFIVTEKLSGQVLNKISGKLQESIAPQGTVVADDSITGSVLQDSDIASYGVIHEFGGQIPARFGNPLMHWIGRDGEDVYRHFAKGFTLPERSFMRAALEDFSPQVEEAIILAVARGIGE
jgi:phage gpG-like protein